MRLSLVPELPRGRPRAPLWVTMVHFPFRKQVTGVECRQQEAEGSDALFVLGLAAFLNPI